jgi:hypothetical protein
MRIPGPVRSLIKRSILATQRPAADAAWRVGAQSLPGLEIRWPTRLGWAQTWTWIEPLYYGFKSRTTVVHRDIPQHLKGAAVIEVCRSGRTYRVALNCSDYPQLIHLGQATGANEGLALEFKMQYLKGGYGIANIVPGGYVADSMLVDWHARGPRRERDRQRFLFDVYGRFGLQFATEVRAAVISALSSQSRCRFFGGGNKVGYREFLHEVARSRVCLDLPGNGPFCFRLVNYLAVGACVVSPPHPTEMPEPLIDRKHIVYTKPDMSDLVELCNHYSREADAREAVMRAGREYYRRHLYWRSLSDYYLSTMLNRLPP